MTKALLLVDIQNDYFSGGKIELVGMDEAAEKARTVLDFFRKHNLPIYHIQHISNRPNAPFFLPNTEGVEINKRVSPLASETVVQKHYPNSFRETTLLNYLQKARVKQLVILGAMTHMCIDATTRAGFDYGYDCTVIEDACATRDLKYGELQVPAKYIQAGFLSALNAVYAQIKPSKDFISVGEK